MIHKQAATLGLIATVLVIAAASLGLFERFERRTIDLRLGNARLQRDPMSSHIVHIDIDDGAIDTVGRWPWPRSRLADAVDELRRAGARVVVLDLLLDDPSADPAEDERLAEAISRIPTVLAIATTEAWEFGELWEETTGIGERYRLLDHLCLDIAVDPEKAADDIGLTSHRRQRFLARPGAFKQVAIWRHLTRRMADSDPPRDVETIIHELSPHARRGVHVQEISLIRDAWMRYHTWLLLRDHLPGEPSNRLSRDRAPVEPFAAAAAMVGFVNADEDTGGSIRFTSPLRRTPVGGAIPLGVAAALVFEGLSAHDLEISSDAMIFDSLQRSLPLHHGALWICWPTSDTSPKWEGLLRQTEIDPPTRGHISIGALVELAEQRRVLERNVERFDAMVRAYARSVYGVDLVRGESLPPAVLDEVRDDIEFFLADESRWGDDEPVDEDARRQEESLRLIRTLDLEVDRGRQIIRQLETIIEIQVNDRLAFVGTTFTGAFTDVAPTAVGTRTPGVVVHAAIADMVLRNRSLRFAPDWTMPALAGLLGVVCTLLAVRLSSAVSAIALASALVAYLGLAGVVTFDRSLLIMPLIAPVFAGFAAWVSTTAFAAALYQRDRSRITRQFKARVSPQLVDQLIENPDALSVLGDEREVTILFCDLVGFTPLAERLGGPQTVAILNTTLGALTRIITEHHGYVNKFLGDGLMAFWSAFEKDPHQAQRACEAVIACHGALKGTPDGLRMRAGIATGRVVVGDCGAPPHLNDYTVIGDAVNLAARLESANRMFGTLALIDETTHAALSETATDQTKPKRLRRLGRVIVQGQSKATNLYELLMDDDDEVSDAELALTDEAVGAFIDGDLDRARTKFEEIIARHGDRAFAQIYIEAIEHDRRETDGSLRLSGK